MIGNQTLYKIYILLNFQEQKKLTKIVVTNLHSRVVQADIAVRFHKFLMILAMMRDPLLQ